MKLYAWMVYEEDTNEWNIIAAGLPGMGTSAWAHPLVTSQLAVAHKMSRYAEAHRKASRKPVQLVAFKSSELLEELP